MTSPYSFLDHSPGSEPVRTDPRVQAKIAPWAYVGFGLAALYLIVAVYELTGPSVFLGLWCIVVAVFSGLGGIQLRKENYDSTCLSWRIAGIMGLPLGLVLLIGCGFITVTIKKADDLEFQQMMDKEKSQV